MKRWGHLHTLIGGVAVGAGVTHGPLGALVIFAAGFGLGAAVHFAIAKTRAAAAYAADLVDARERRANAAAVDRRNASERADARLALAIEKARRFAGYDQSDEVPF